MDKGVLVHQMTERFGELYAKAIDSLAEAPDGKWIEASEFVFRDVFQELLRESYEAAVQARVDAHPTAWQAAFSPCGPGVGRCLVGSQQGPAQSDGVDGVGKG